MATNVTATPPVERAKLMASSAFSSIVNIIKLGKDARSLVHLFAALKAISKRADEAAEAFKTAILNDEALKGAMAASTDTPFGSVTLQKSGGGKYTIDNALARKLLGDKRFHEMAVLPSMTALKAKCTPQELEKLTNAGAIVAPKSSLTLAFSIKDGI